MLQGFVVALTLVQRREQLQDHALERARVVGQLLGGGRRQASGGGVREAHTYMTYHRPYLFLRKRKKAGAARPFMPSPAGGNAGRAGPSTSRCRPGASPTPRRGG